MEGADQGHILLAAARRIATELAVVRTGEEQPSPSAYRAALRDVIRTCVYGVDLNPLAVELCKVALWLEAHNPGEPLNFLDHHIKCGNAIVGFVKREEVDAGVPDEAFSKLPADDADIGKQVRAKNKRERKVRRTVPFAFTSERQGEIAGVLDRWTLITGMPERTPAEIDAKKQAFESFTSGGAAWVLKQIASLSIAQFYLPRTRENGNALVTDGEFAGYWSGNATPPRQASVAASTIANRKRFFHWFLEFPEIVQRGGFDCILGNPPYLGGQALSGTYGHGFCSYVRKAFDPTGLSDLVVYFLRRMFGLIRPNGFVAFITTNSIKDGDVRRDGLEQVLVQQGQIVMAVRAIKWPGVANLTVSLLSIIKGPWGSRRKLDGQDAGYISSFLDDVLEARDPQPLDENDGKMAVGTHYLGDGFVVNRARANQMISEHASNREVLFPLFNCDELNNTPDQHADRFIIDFQARSEDAARQYVVPFSIVQDLVRPVRAQESERRLRERWWQFKRPFSEIRDKSASLERFFVCGITTKHLSFSALSVDHVFSHAVCGIVSDRWDVYALVQSSLHEAWARKRSGAHELRLRYSPSNCFETFPFPSGLWRTVSPSLAACGEHYHEHRRRLMLSLWLGLTDVYNLFHRRELEAELKKHFASRSKKDPQSLNVPAEHRASVRAFDYESALAGIRVLRELHVDLDTAVISAYGWHKPGVDGPAIVLGHDFHEVETLPEDDRTRFTISPSARKELLRRLLALNHRRAKEAPSIGAPTSKARRSESAVSSERVNTSHLFPEQP